ncbi:MAG: prolipoprotein diacylglyceryl transferase [bacterium]
MSIEIEVLSMVDPVLFHVGSRPIYWYGVMMAFAFLAGITHWNWLGRRTGRDVSISGDLAFWLMVGGLIGARTAYVISNFSYYHAAPQEIIRVDQGGLIFYGGFIGGLLIFIAFARWRKLNVLDLADFAVTAIPLGHALGRVGCFLNGCCGGSAVSPPSLLSCGLDHYPVQLYEAALNLGVYVLLTWFFLKRRGTRSGSVMALYLTTYPVCRFLLEFFRGDDRMRLGTIDVAQGISIGLFATGLILWALIFRTARNASPTGK